MQNQRRDQKKKTLRRRPAQTLLACAMSAWFALGLATPSISESKEKESESKNISVIGMDSVRVVVGTIPVDLYAEILATTVESVSDTITLALDNVGKVDPKTGRPAYELRTIGVGVGVNGQVGAGPLINLTVSPKLRLVFTDSLYPVYPQ
jgi:hypothetical protein